MTDDELLQKALGLSYFYLKLRPRSEWEIREYLVKKTKKYPFTESIIDDVISRLKELKFINDKEYVEWYVRVRSREKPRSAYLLRLELKRRGIAKSHLEDYFVDDVLDEEKLAVEALSRIWRRIGREERQKRFQKAVSHLARRGFRYDLIKKAIAEMEEKR